MKSYYDIATLEFDGTLITMKPMFNMLSIIASAIAVDFVYFWRFQAAVLPTASCAWMPFYLASRLP
eukprot:5819041-Amphidinium_carterae.1